ncbi:hypothetical protein [Streptomyces ureilyticus]|uniref:Uncharacterized protein n=1 Tax=Streptomyces ureilyticus TaxID=1775131 RepID=A0ABX0DJU9_9ACTN|nr:hypothetical protein [Streptomyces ureilyticus]NGO42063.1 hypothetical protein [Streptomyces ureilyticus]
MADLTQDVRLVLTGRIEFQQDISVAQGARVIGLLQASPEPELPASRPEPVALPPPLALEAEEAPPELPARESAPPRKRIEGPRQALELSGARTIPERMTAFAAYLLKAEGHETFTQGDIRRLFQRARDRVPSHFTREFDKAVHAGWIHEGETKGEFYLSQTAQGVFEDRFDALRGKRSRKPDSAASSSRGTVRRAPRPVPVPEPFSSLDHIPTTLDGVIPYHKVKLKRDKLLWALKLAKQLGIDALQSPEAAWLTDKVGDGLPTRDMYGHFMGLSRQGYANRSMIDNAMRITEAGEEYLASL